MSNAHPQLETQPSTRAPRVARSRWGWLIAVCFATPVFAIVPPWFHRTRAPVRRGIPARQYQFRHFTPAARALSSESVLLRPSTTLADGRKANRLKAFQFIEKAQLSIQHCSIGQVSILLEENGDFVVTLRAEQNRAPLSLDPEGQAGSSQRPLQARPHIQRNRFHVSIRCYGRHSGDRHPAPIGKPVVVPLDLKPFWVQRGNSKLHYERGNDSRISRYFELIDRVEVEFRFESAEAHSDARS